MADKASKGKAKAEREKTSVLGNLPATRPERLGRPRSDGRPRAAPARVEPTAKADAEKPAAAEITGETDAPRRRPAAVRPGARPLEGQQRVGDPPPVRTVAPPRGTELVTTTIQAMGELAQIGFTVGGRALKRAVDRLPKL